MTVQKIADGAYFVPSYSTQTIECEASPFCTQTVVVQEVRPEPDEVREITPTDS